MQTQVQGLKNFSVNIKDTMLKIKDAVRDGKGKPAKLTIHEQNSIMQFYLEVVDYLGKQEMT